MSFEDWWYEHYGLHYPICIIYYPYKYLYLHIRCMMRRIKV